MCRNINKILVQVFTCFILVVEAFGQISPQIKTGPQISLNTERTCQLSLAFQFDVATLSTAESSLNSPYMALYFLKASNPCEMARDSGFSFYSAEPIRGGEWLASYKRRIINNLGRYGITRVDVITRRLPTSETTALYPSDFDVVVMSSSKVVWVLGLANVYNGSYAYAGSSPLRCNFLDSGRFQPFTGDDFLNPRRFDFQTEVKVPFNMNHRAQNIYLHVESVIRQHLGTAQKNIICAGFDYAAPVTLLMARYLEKNRGININAVYTFGGHRLVEGEHSAMNASSLFDEYFFSADYVLHGDEVTRYPFLFYSPSRRLYSIRSNGEIFNGGAPEQRNFTTNDKRNHRISEYLKNLYNAYIAPNQIYKACLPRPND